MTWDNNQPLRRRPGLAPTILITGFFGLFGLIPAIRAARRGIVDQRRLGGVLPVPPVVVGMDVEDHERTLRRESVEAFGDRAIEGVIDGQRGFDLGGGQGRRTPDIEPPGLLGGAINGTLSGLLKSTSNRLVWATTRAGMRAPMRSVNGSSSRNRTSSGRTISSASSGRTS